MFKRRSSFVLIASALLCSLSALSSCTVIPNRAPSSSDSSATARFEIANGEELELAVSRTAQIDLIREGVEGEVSYSSSDVAVATISKSGLITALKAGETTILASCGAYEDSLRLRVVDPGPIPLPTIELLSEPSMELAIGETKSIRYSIAHSEAQPTFSSSVPNLVSHRFLNEGEVALTGWLAGSTTCTLALEGGNAVEVAVNVKEETGPTSLTLSAAKETLRVGETLELKIPELSDEDWAKTQFEIVEGNAKVSFDGRSLRALSSGSITFLAQCGKTRSNPLSLSIHDFEIAMDSSSLEVNAHQRVRLSHYSGAHANSLQWEIENPSVATILYDALGHLIIEAKSVGSTAFHLYDADGLISNALRLEVLGGNPYLAMSKDEFYANYSPATSRQDAIYRSEASFLSGVNSVPDQAPSIASARPSANGKLIHNQDTLYSDAGRAYTVLDERGQEAFTVYQGAAYVTLEEVAAYVYAWGDVPVNYVASKKANPASSPWGEHLRLNFSKFIGNTSSYPYEPELPRISGCGGDLVYYEIDIGTTGTDCDPNYDVRTYNDGSKITRGAARIVFSRFYDGTQNPVETKDRYVFYTYNHYNDFQEYLNYENGWGEMFGNITGGGTLSSRDPSQCNPTPYVETLRASLKA